MDERSVFQNDLCLLEPDYGYNRYHLTILDCSFYQDLSLGLKVTKIDDYSGKPPCPRSHFQMVHLVSQSEQLLVVYGGRNDAIFVQTNNVALNDICIYNINRNTWEALALFGQMPCSRWSHFMAVVTGKAEEGFLMFGGANLETFCRSCIWNFTLHKQPPKNNRKVVFGSKNN